HGGFLNLMTHQHETVIVAAVSKDPVTTAVNTNPHFSEISFSLRKLSKASSFQASWNEFITAPGVRRRVVQNTDSWQNYVEGCALNVQYRLRECIVPDLYLAIGSNLPHGAALSSSAALCTSLVLAFSHWMGRTMPPEEVILAARDGEWYAGSRCGVSDQTAMVLGAAGTCVHVALQPTRLDVSSARSYVIPEEVDILVIDSRTQGSISGKQLIDYTRNRFAYSLALHVSRRELAGLGVSAERVEQIAALSDLSPAVWQENDGLSLIYQVLLRIPERIRLSELRKRYDIPELEALYAQHFGNIAEEERPDTFRIRGPLLFGIAESERARVFPQAIARADWRRAGKLMCIGHDGDRRVKEDGSPYVFDTSDRALTRLAESKMPIEQCAGAYGASTRALDFLVDAALEAGAYGASLTGAGLAGSVLALCPQSQSAIIAEHLRHTIVSPEYAAISGLLKPTSTAEASDSVMINTAIEGAGEMLP
ncbi:MAG: hypothetical protein R6V12_16045, partial [Candidatus Hydrogenedentota bacterium]